VRIELYIFAFISVAYGTFITLAIIGFGKLNRIVKNSSLIDPSFISIVISARNEYQNIEKCLQQIIKQNFPKNGFELILIDDASEDETYNIAYKMLAQSGLTHQIIKQTKHQGKKQNLSLAIKKSKGSIIITSDADVIYRHNDWLLTISNYFKTYSPNLLIMPIDFETHAGVLETFQIVENLALTGITAGYSGIKKPFMCNGANLAFKKSAFDLVSGYDSHLHISSGEDVFLMEDIKKINPTSIHYGLLRELIVKTEPLNNIQSLLSQRIRWASKAKDNSNYLNLFAGFIILATNLLFLALFVAILKKSVIIPYLSIFVLAKFVFDFLLLFLASDFLGRKKNIWWLIPFECIYWLYALFVGTASLFLKPYWKGKKIN
jgi:biofilm PGA synthesis N-glycosyltransferase PgaC